MGNLFAHAVLWMCEGDKKCEKFKKCERCEKKAGLTFRTCRTSRTNMDYMDIMDAMDIHGHTLTDMDGHRLHRLRMICTDALLRFATGAFGKNGTNGTYGADGTNGANRTIWDGQGRRNLRFKI
jgi:hypothetical protein